MSLLALLVQNLAAQKSYNQLNMSMREALASRACCMEGVLKCYRHETLETVIDRIAKAEVGGPSGPPPGPAPWPHLACVLAAFSSNRFPAQQ